MCASRAGLRGKELLLADRRSGDRRPPDAEHPDRRRPEGEVEVEGRERNARAAVGATDREAREDARAGVPAAAAGGVRAERGAVRPQEHKLHRPHRARPLRDRGGRAGDHLLPHVDAAAVRHGFRTSEAGPHGGIERPAVDADGVVSDVRDADIESAHVRLSRVPAHIEPGRHDGRADTRAAEPRRADVPAGSAVVDVSLRADAGAAADALPGGAGAGTRDAGLARGAAVATHATVGDARHEERLAPSDRVAVAVAEARVAGAHHAGARRAARRRVRERAGAAAHAAVRAAGASVDLAAVRGAAVAVREARGADADAAGARGAHGGGVRRRRTRVVAAAAVGDARAGVDAGVPAALLAGRTDAAAHAAGADRPERARATATAAVAIVVLRVHADAAAARLPDGAGPRAGVDGHVGRHHVEGVEAVVGRDVGRVERVRTRVDDVGAHHDIRPVGLDVGHDDVGPVVGTERAVARVHAGFGGRSGVGVGRGSVRAAIESVVRDDDVAGLVALHVHRHVHERPVGRSLSRVRRTILHDRTVQGRNPEHPRGRGGLIHHSAAARECGQQQPFSHQHVSPFTKQSGPQTWNCEIHESPNGRTRRPAQICE